jgi:hypothetical protein
VIVQAEPHQIGDKSIIGACQQMAAVAKIEINSAMTSLKDTLRRPGSAERANR